MPQPTVGGIGLKADEFKEIVQEVTEDAVIARQASYDTVMELLSETISGDEALALLAGLDLEEFAQLMARNPEQARKALEDLRLREA